MIYVSTGGHSNWPFEKTIDYLSSAGIHTFELSGGIHCENVENKINLLLNKGLKIVCHNYFPPPRNPFVFNLASLNEEITAKSICHAKNAIDLSSKIGSKYYSVHAGYLIDPEVNELGQLIKGRAINDRNLSKDLFIDRINNLSKYAYDKNVKLLIENNVLSSKNYQQFRKNPLLMVDPNETNSIFKKMDSNVGLLIDVAHLKVSANTLGFSTSDFMNRFREITCAYHLSDNNGLEDSNSPINEHSWFWPYINNNLPYYSLEIYNVDASTLKSQIDIVSKKIYS